VRTPGVTARWALGAAMTQQGPRPARCSARTGRGEVCRDSPLEQRAPATWAVPRAGCPAPGGDAGPSSAATRQCRNRRPPSAPGFSCAARGAWGLSGLGKGGLRVSPGSCGGGQPGDPPTGHRAHLQHRGLFSALASQLTRSQIRPGRCTVSRPGCKGGGRCGPPQAVGAPRSRAQHARMQASPRQRRSLTRPDMQKGAEWERQWHRREEC